MNYDNYHATRLQRDRKHQIVWSCLCDFFFNRLMSPQGTILDLGAGYGGFINHIDAQRKFALDSWQGMTTY